MATTEFPHFDRLDPYDVTSFRFVSWCVCCVAVWIASMACRLGWHWLQACLCAVGVAAARERKQDQIDRARIRLYMAQILHHAGILNILQGNDPAEHDQDNSNAQKRHTE